jgi:hypothetical protein
VASLGYREPSFVFLIGTDLAMMDTAAEATSFLRGDGCRLLYVEDRFAPAFAAAAASAGFGPTQVGAVSGFNINGGRRVALTAYASIPDPTP